MSAQVDADWSYRGLQVVRLENEVLQIDVLPELGAKVWNLVHKPTQRNLLWHNPYLAPERQRYGARFDDTWSGGWDELIPNDVPTEVAFGDMLPDHGEVWSQPAKWDLLDAGGNVASVRFVHHGRIWRTRFEKTITLRAGESTFRVAYRYENQGLLPIDFLWNIHPALAVSPATRVDLPAKSGHVDSWSTLCWDGNTEFEWPWLVERAGRRVDLRRMPQRGTLADIHLYLPDVTAGWYAVTDTDARIGFGVAFPTATFPHLWMFRPTGGWRGLYTQIVEISTGYPSRLAEARAEGHCAHLEPGQALEAEIVAVVFGGLTGVERIEPDGRVIAVRDAAA